ncbi:serine hydrolase domain-containing protein [Flavobacteriaceae bacterium S356]|uniref:Serine hydrolase domain-containing protein n=1 Tax=Asprobacillus argus TaxID=3076534 RepID=A0ABU3LF58_9FLAO|nr:serine hydrolase domain-containing protein [Flavobacteriaceae bacterium S356]
MKTNHKVLYSSTLFFFFVTILIAQEVKTKDIDAIFSEWNTLEKPGMSVMVMKDDKIVYEKGFGSANLEYDIPITKNTVFHVASVSKQFTAFAVLLLEKDGKLSMDDDVRKYLPELPDYGKKITLRNLANHSSGLRDQWDLLRMSGIRLDDVITQEHILKLVNRQKSLNFDPNKRNMYSNTGFTLLAEVIEKVSGMSFADFTKKRIFEPLGMNNSEFYDDHQKIVANRAYSYKVRDKKFIKSTLSYATVGPTSLFTTAEDFGKWALNFQNPIVGDMSIIRKLNTRTKLIGGSETGYAMGQFVGTYRGIEVVVHSGSDAGYKAYFARIPSHNLSIAVFSNLSTIDPVDQVFTIANLFLEGKFPKQDASKKEEIVVHDPSMFIKLSQKQLSKFLGEYWEVDEKYKRKVLLKNDTLVYYRNEKSETRLVPTDKNKFKMMKDPNDVDVVFEKNDQGIKIMKVSINDRKPIKFVAFGNVNLNEYLGTYQSKELGTSYRITIKKGKLTLEHQRIRDIHFDPINKNLFVSKKRAIQELKFLRNKRGKVIGFKASNNRVKNLVFKN